MRSRLSRLERVGFCFNRAVIRDYIGNHYEVSMPPTATTKYYYFGAQRVAMQNAQGITYLHGDHLGSTSVTSGANSSTQVYYPFGAVRASSGSLPTDFTFTGQKIDASDGLMYYGARYYDAALGRFISADTLVPSAGNPQSLNRYAYVLNNPLRYTDPTGHRACGDYGEDTCGNEGTGTPPPAVTGDNQNPSGGDDACNLARCGGDNPSGNQTPGVPPGTPTAPQTWPTQTGTGAWPDYSKINPRAVTLDLISLIGGFWSEVTAVGIVSVQPEVIFVGGAMVTADYLATKQSIEDVNQQYASGQISGEEATFRVILLEVGLAGIPGLSNAADVTTMLWDLSPAFVPPR